MVDTDWVLALKNKFSDTVAEVSSGCLVLPAEDIFRAINLLKREYSFDYLMNLAAIDYKDKLAVVYNLYSFRLKGKVCLKVFLPRDNPAIESLTEIYPAANWQEREAFDLMGIKFIGHPDLRRILLPDDYIGHPLRKDYTKEGFVPMPAV
jgi:NADH-quinone oxidoreductase subunit C